MIRGIFEEKRTYFRAEEGSGGWGGEDPFERDEQLADIFKRTLTLAIARRMSTPNPFGIAEMVGEIIERANQAGPALILMAQSLRPIAKTLLNIPSPSDRVNLGKLETVFKDFDLSVEP